MRKFAPLKICLKHKTWMLFLVALTSLMVLYHRRRPAAVSETPPNYLDRVKNITGCTDRPRTFKMHQRGDFWVLYNYVPARKSFRCHESVTYTTQADYTFIDNLLSVVARWRGPVSVAMHAPGHDFQTTLDSIAYLRDCTDGMVKDYVTFHIYFSARHVPEEIPPHGRVFTEPYDCISPPPYAHASPEEMYKTKNRLLYPINVARNIARETAQTHFVFASDIELYPSPHVIPKFLNMVAADPKSLGRTPRVFVLHVFEVAHDQPVPSTKRKLLKMLSNGTAVTFHRKVCQKCHAVPKTAEWLEAEPGQGLGVFAVGKRRGNFRSWEPFYIGTHEDPLFDERLTWEGRSNKMAQAYTLCVLDYDFAVLDNAFLVHRPGIKMEKPDKSRLSVAANTNRLIKTVILPEYNSLYGTREGCAIS